MRCANHAHVPQTMHETISARMNAFVWLGLGPGIVCGTRAMFVHCVCIVCMHEDIDDASKGRHNMPLSLLMQKRWPLWVVPTPD